MLPTVISTLHCLFFSTLTYFTYFPSVKRPPTLPKREHRKEDPDNPKEFRSCRCHGMDLGFYNFVLN